MKFCINCGCEPGSERAAEPCSSLTFDGEEYRNVESRHQFRKQILCVCGKKITCYGFTLTSATVDGTTASAAVF